MNICRDIRRRVIYGKGDEEREISLESFLPFSIGLGAIKKEVFKNSRFPENFGKNAAEDTLFQINCHRRREIFLYSPKIKGIHDHNLNHTAILGKLFTEIRGVGDLLHYFSKRNLELPFKSCFLSYPLFFMASQGLLLLNRFFFPFFLTSFIIEVVLAAQCFKDKKESIFLRSKAFVYCLIGEFTKGFYLPCYLSYKTNFSLPLLVRGFYQFLEWEKEKLRKSFNLLALIKSTKIEYAKI